jgi:excisionase family DNA binding protein
MSQMLELRTSEVVRIPEALKLLKISRNRLVEGIANGEIPAIRVCGMTRIPKAWLDEAIQRALAKVQVQPATKPPSRRGRKISRACGAQDPVQESPAMVAMNKD